MTVLEDQIVVFRLALETEYRTAGEEAALRREAERLSRRWNQGALGGFGRPSLEVRRARPVDLVHEMDRAPAEGAHT